MLFLKLQNVILSNLESHILQMSNIIIFIYLHIFLINKPLFHVFKHLGTFCLKVLLH
jgi:hypothetical protein